MARVTPDQEAKAIAMYQAGAKIGKITAETGLPQSTFYYLLAKNGLQPKRSQRSQRIAKEGAEGLRMTFDTMLERMLEQQRTVADLQHALAEKDHEIERLQATVQRLKAARAK